MTRTCPTCAHTNAGSELLPHYAPGADVDAVPLAERVALLCPSGRRRRHRAERRPLPLTAQLLVIFTLPLWLPVAPAAGHIRRTITRRTA